MTPTPAPPAWAHRTTDATAEQLAAVDAWWRSSQARLRSRFHLMGLRLDTSAEAFLASMAQGSWQSARL